MAIAMSKNIIYAALTLILKKMSPVLATYSSRSILIRFNNF